MALVIGDVMGKGIPAGLLMTMLEDAACRGSYSFEWTHG